MEHNVAKRVAKDAMCERVRYVVERRKSVANVLVSSPTPDSVSARIICEMTDYLTTHLGRNAYGTTRLQKGRIKDYKARQGRRRDATQNTFAHNVDMHRTWLHFRSHFVPGGSVWSSMGRSEKRRIRCAIQQADLHVSTYGDYVGAFEIVKGK